MFGCGTLAVAVALVLFSSSVDAFLRHVDHKVDTVLEDAAFAAYAENARRAGVKGRIPAAPVAKLSHIALRHDLVNGGSKAQAKTRDEILEKWVDSGKAVASELSSKELAALVEPITQETFAAELHGVSDPFGSRFVTQPGNKKASEFLKLRFAQLGFEVREQEFDASPLARMQNPGGNMSDKNGSSGNIIAFKKGTDLAHEMVIFGAHYDSVNWQDGAAGASPGVDDNGSGIAAVLQAAKAIAAQALERPLRRSVALVAFQAEEVGLVGSTHFVKDVLVGNGSAALNLALGKPVAVLIADEVAYPGTSARGSLKKCIFETSGHGEAKDAMIDTLAHAASDDKGIAGFEVNYHGFGSDHMPFLEAGFPAVLLIERDNSYHSDEWGHSSHDTFEHVDNNFGATLTRLATRTLLTLASPKK